MGKGLSKVLGKLLDENPSGEQDAMKEVEPSGEQDAMKEVSGTEKGLVSNIKKAANFAKKVIKKDHEHYQKQKHHPKDWHKWLPGNNPFYDVEPSGEQDAMNEVSGTGAVPGWMKNVGTAVMKGVITVDAAATAAKLVAKGGVKKAAKELKYLWKHLDENPSGEQDAMKEVSGTEKGFLANFEKAVVKGGTEAAKIVTNVVKKDHEHYQKQKHHPKDWHKWLPGNNPFCDENPSGEQDAMKEVEPSGEQDSMKEVSGTEKGLVSGIIKDASKVVAAGGKAAAKIVHAGGKAAGKAVVITGDAAASPFKLLGMKGTAKVVKTTAKGLSKVLGKLLDENPSGETPSKGLA